MVGDGTFERALLSSYRLSIHISYQLSSARHFRSEFLAGVANPNLGKGGRMGAAADPGFARGAPKWGSGEPPGGSKGRAPGGGS